MGELPAALARHRLQQERAAERHPESWAELWEPHFRGRLTCPRCRTPKGCANLFIAASLESGQPTAQAQFNVEPGFQRLVRLKPNLLTIYTQMPQAFNLLEQGEAWMIAGGALLLCARAQEGGRADRPRRAARRRLRHAVGRRGGEGRAAVRARLRLCQRAARAPNCRASSSAPTYLAADQHRRAGAGRHADRRRGPSDRLGAMSRPSATHWVAALGPRDGASDAACTSLPSDRHAGWPQLRLSRHRRRATKRFGTAHRARRRRSRVGARRVRLAARPVGLRQDDAAAHRRRAAARRPRHASASTARTSRGARRTGATSASSSRATRCSRISPSPRTSPSA